MGRAKIEIGRGVKVHEQWQQMEIKIRINTRSEICRDNHSAERFEHSVNIDSSMVLKYVGSSKAAWDHARRR